MGHNVQAIITTETIDEADAENLHLPIFNLELGSLIGLHYSIIDYWADKTPMEYETYHDVLFIDCSIVQHFAQKLDIKKYAIIETAYFGGMGHQAATVYNNTQKIMPVRICEGFPNRINFRIGKKPINKALSLLGIPCTKSSDEFTTFGLQNFRNMEDYFYNEDDELLWEANSE